MYGLAKVANEYPAGYSREDILRQQLDEREDELKSLERSVPGDVQRDQRKAESIRAAAGTAIGGGAGAGLMAMAAGQGNRLRGAGIGGLVGGVAGSGIGTLLGVRKAQHILEEREPELANQISQAYDEMIAADDRLDRHMSYSNPHLDIQKELLELKRQELARQQGM